MVGVTVIFVVIIYALAVRMLVSIFTSDIEPKSRGRTWQAYSYIAFGVLPFIDVIIGNARLGVICVVEAHAKVHKDIVLPARYFDEQHRPNFLYGADHLVDWAKLKDVITYDSKSEDYAFPRIRRTRVYIRERNGQLLAESTQFFYRGNWLTAVQTSVGAGSSGCGDVRQLDDAVKQRIKRQS